MYYVNKILPEKNVQIRVERSRLKAELSLIEKQKRSELKMHESEAQKIKSRYSKTGVYSDSFSEAAGVKMYETHNPGFCYKRNGAHKIPPSMSSVPVLDFQQLRGLLFTNDELDIEKLLCLHMLSVHRTETLTMPNLKHLKDVPKENTPVERLIQRSKKINKQKKEHYEILNILPIYIIDIGQGQSCATINSIPKEETEDHLFRDTRINSRLMVNTKIQEILASVLTALKTTKSEKLKEILESCQNHTFLKKIFNRMPIQEFLKILKTYSLITSCESYVLTPKIKHQPIQLEIRTVFGHLEALILQIRKYVLQIPSKTRNEWKSLYEFDEEILQDLTSSMSRHLIFYDTSSKSAANPKKSSRSVVSSARVKNSELLEKSVSYLDRRSFKSFTRNILSVQDENANRTVTDGEDKPKKISNTSGTKKIVPFVPSSKPSQLPSIASGHEAQMKRLEELRSQDTPGSKYEENEERLTKSTIPEADSMIKRFSCCACQEKWKRSLPSPKIPNYKRPGLPTQIYEDPYKIKNMNRVSSMISRELYKLDSYDTKYSIENAYARVKSPQNSSPPATLEKENSTVDDSLEISPYDLARVIQEITDKETDKKLDQFLKETI